MAGTIAGDGDGDGDGDGESIQGTLHGPDKFQHSRGISSLCASHAQRCSIVILGLLFLIFEIFNETDNVSSVYTSGRKCNFQKKGCEAPQV